jgi:hypothetical protein
MGRLRLGAHSESLGYGGMNDENNAVQKLIHLGQLAVRPHVV